ncbi:MAG: cell division protein FtsA, partial [Acidiphilium sp. 37-67-22]
GASQLVGARELAAQILDRQVRIGKPLGVIGLPDAATVPNFATMIGLLAFATGEGQTMHDIDFNVAAPQGRLARFMNFLVRRM